ncbi:MAG: PQQ-binding-like beta-propeller repeat protein [Planctomycetota bacterium]
MPRASIRVWPAFLILTVLAVYLFWNWKQESSYRQSLVLATGSAILIASIALLLWWTFASRLSWKARTIGLGLVAIALVAFSVLFELRGVSGDLIPVFVPRWSEPVALDRYAPPEGQPIDQPAFPQFRGPDRNGTVQDTGWITDWSSHPPQILWRRSIGRGWSGFAIAKGLAVTQDQLEDRERVIAVDLSDGHEVWVHANDRTFESVLGGDGPRATPIIHGEAVYTFGATGRLDALRLADGELLWTVDVQAETGAAVPEWGFSSSPLVDDGRVIVVAGAASRNAMLVAYSVETGEQIWSGGTDRASYCSPRIAELASRRQILMLNASSVTGHDPETGAELWTTSFPSRSPHVAMPVPIGDDRVLVSSGYNVGSKLYRLSSSDGELAAELLWESRHLRSKFSNVIVIGGFAYGLNDGILTCLDLADGSRKWRGERLGHGQLLLAGDHLLVQSESGEIVLVEPGPDALKVVSRFQALEGKVWNPPALAGPLLLVRSDSEAVLYELRADEAR